tara:strand:- start:28 stop:1152 length:1125 start_codon:yes stop_codon:yes gene_type:complete
MFLNFGEYKNSLNEAKASKFITQTLISKYPDNFSKHSKTHRVKNLKSISPEEFSQKIKETFKEAENLTIINPPMSGSTKYPSVQFELDGQSFNIVLAGGAIASKGHGFEYDLEKDLKTLSKVKYFNPDLYIYDYIINDIIKEFNINQDSDINVELEGNLNKKRPIEISENGITVGTDNNLDIGSTVTDITAEIDGDRKYLSLKHGMTVQLANNSITGFIPQSEVKNGKIENKFGLKVFDFFKIDNDLFCRTFNEYKKTNFKQYHETKSLDPKLVENFMRSAIGYGYYMVHLDDKGKKYMFYPVTKSYMQKASKLSGKAEILYGGSTGKSKMVVVRFSTPVFKIDMEFRNNNKGIEPNILGTKYRYVNFKGSKIE